MSLDEIKYVQNMEFLNSNFSKICDNKKKRAGIIAGNNCYGITPRHGFSSTNYNCNLNEKKLFLAFFCSFFFSCQRLINDLRNSLS